MKNFYTLLLASLSTVTFAQQTISFEPSEGYQPGTIHGQNGWEVTEGSGGFIQNQIITNEKNSNGSSSFKNAHEPTFGDQMFPIFGAVKSFEQPMPYSNFTISYDVLATAKMGADFEFTLFATNEDEIFVPVAGVGIENRGFIYLITDENFGFEYATSEWTPDQWVNVRIEVTTNTISYYINNVAELTIPNFTQLNIEGFNMLHNNFGNDAYYDNFVITTGNLSTGDFNKSAVAVYPNPADDVISVQLPAGQVLQHVELYTITGQRVLKSDSQQTVNVSMLPAGAYLLTATSADGSSLTKKIIKK